MSATKSFTALEITPKSHGHKPGLTTGYRPSIRQLSEKLELGLISKTFDLRMQVSRGGLLQDVQPKAGSYAQSFIERSSGSLVFSACGRVLAMLGVSSLARQDV
jgi:hypothetical protein